MNDEIIKLLAERYYKKVHISDWAIKCLEKGFDSKSLRMLASMSNFLISPFELDDFFKRTLKELGWNVISSEDYLTRYAKILAREIIEDKTNPLKAARDIYRIFVDLDYPAEFGGFWHELDEMIWDHEYFLKTGTKGYWFRPKEQLTAEIKTASKELLESKKLT